MTIKEMLLSGKTPNDLLKEITKAQKEIDAEKDAAARRQKELDTKRETAINALNDYIGAVYGRKMSVNDLRELSKEFQAIEKVTEELGKSSVQFTRDEQEKEEKVMSDDEKIRKWMRAVLGE